MTLLGKVKKIFFADFKCYNLSIHAVKWAEFLSTCSHTSLVSFCTVKISKKVLFSIFSQ
jgi:hypothetical protein